MPSPTPFRDIFGFETRPPAASPIGGTGGDLPILPLRTEAVVNSLRRLSVHLKRPSEPFPNQLEWGDNPGALQVYFSPEGSHRAIIRRLALGFDGQPAWLCKRVFPLRGRDGQVDEQSWVETIHDALLEVDQTLEEMPARDWDGIERLAMRVAQRVRVDASSLFAGELIRRLDQDNFMVYATAGGGGVGAANQRRVEQFDMNISFVRPSGLIRIWSYDVSSHSGGNTWQIQPSRWDETFSPVQGREIEDAVGRLVGST